MSKLVKKVVTLAMVALLGGSLLAGRLCLAASGETMLADVLYSNFPGVEMDMPADGNTVSYIVQPGDTLATIAGRFGVSVETLQEVNNLGDANLILTGEVLRLPGGVTEHLVLPGETLSDIARRYDLPVAGLVAANRLPDPDLVFPGEKIIIPVAGRDELPGGNDMAALPVNQLAWPVVGWVSSPFGLRDGRPHEGVDIAASEGDSIRTVKEGWVVFAGPRGTYGNTVIINHGNGLETLYAHASRVLVQPGQWVNTGDVIALVGSTGRSTGPHLHLEVRLNGIPYDPLLCLQRMRV